MVLIRFGEDMSSGSSVSNLGRRRHSFRKLTITDARIWS
jgi:hypothetical protein